jgi:hypothetical protein
VKTVKLNKLYLKDETAWLEAMAELIRQRRHEELDYKNLREYLLDMARRDRREVASRLTVLLAHILKWDYQPRSRSRSWMLTMLAQRQELEGCLDSKTLMAHAEAVLPTCYAKAVKRATLETGLSEDKFPTECPYTVDMILSEERTL